MSANSLIPIDGKQYGKPDLSVDGNESPVLGTPSARVLVLVLVPS